MKKNKIEIFKKNLEEEKFSSEFIQKALQYFAELEKETEVNDYNNLEEVLNYYDICGSFTCNTTISELNLKDFRGDISSLKEDYPELLDLNLYFET